MIENDHGDGEKQHILCLWWFFLWMILFRVMIDSIKVGEGLIFMRKVFHGSDHILKLPVYGGGKSDNDYGNGFYTTEYEDRAILLEGFEVPGITVRTAMEKKLIYHQEGDFYE